MVKGRKILAVTDSLGLPRAKPELCVYEETWPSLLRNAGYLVHQVSIGGATISELTRQLEYHYIFDPDIVIVQSGIVDCAPRALSKMESEVLNHYKITRKLLSLILPKYNKFLRKHRAIKYTNKRKYSLFINKLMKQFSEKEFYWIGIIPPFGDYEVKVPGISKAIDEYNSVLASELGSNFISLNDIPSSGVMSDYIHLNKNGHLYIFKLIRNKIDPSM